MPLPAISLIASSLIGRRLSPMHGVGKARARGQVACRTACPRVQMRCAVAWAVWLCPRWRVPVDNRDNPAHSGWRAALSYTDRPPNHYGLAACAFAPILDELRARLLVSEVVGRRVRLKRVASGGASRRSTGEDALVFVNDQKMAWFDFSSGKNGNIFDFVMMTEGSASRRRWSGSRARPAFPAHDLAGGGGPRRAAQDPQRRHGAGGEILRSETLAARRRQGTRLSRRPRARSGHAGQVPSGLRTGRALRAQGALGKEGYRPRT